MAPSVSAAALLTAALAALAQSASLRGGRSPHAADHLAEHRGNDLQRLLPVGEPWEWTDGKGGLTSKLSLRHWRPLLSSVVAVLTPIDFLAPLASSCPGCFSSVEVWSLVLAAIGDAVVVLWTEDPGAAGATTLPAAAAALCVIAALAVGVALAVRFRRDAAKNTKPDVRSDSLGLLLADFVPLLRPCIRGAIALLALDVIFQETSPWGKFFVPLSILLFGVACTLSGVTKDVLAHVRTRIDGRIVEGSCILFRGHEVSLQKLKWRHTVGLIMPKQVPIYIPNHELLGSAPLAQARQTRPTSQIDIRVGFEGETLRDGGLREAVLGARDLLATTAGEDFTFVGCDGRAYGNCLDTAQCEVWVNETGDTLHLRLVGRPTLEDCKTFGMSKRDVNRAWHLQIEWLNLRLRSLCRELAA